MFIGAAGNLQNPFDARKYGIYAFGDVVVHSRRSPHLAQVPGNIEHCSDTALRLKYIRVRPVERQKHPMHDTRASRTQRAKG